MISRTKIKSRTRKKTNPELVDTIRLALTHPAWGSVAKVLSSSTRRLIDINLSEIEKKSERGDTVLIVGKVLSQGEVTKKLKVVSLWISSMALEKLKEAKGEYSNVLDEIKSNPKMEGIKWIK